MTKYIAKRVAAVPVLLWVVASIVFLVLRVIPGNAADVLAQDATALQKTEIARALGLDQSYATQYWLFLKGLAHGNLAYSFYSGQTVTSRLWDTLPVTIELAVVAALIMIPLGVLMGVVAGAFHGSLADSVMRFLSGLLIAVPWFVLGIVLVLLFSVKWHLLPAYGRLPATTIYTPRTHFVLIDAVIEDRYDLIRPWLSHIILPATTVGLINSAFVMRITRAAILEVKREDFIRTARMKGMSEWRVFWRHVFRHASLPIVTIVGLQFGGLLAGAVITENVFSYPGVGRLMVSAISQRDYPIIQGAALAIAFMYIIVNAITDVVILYLDPRLART